MVLACLSRRFFSIKSISLVVLSLQTTTMVLLLRYSRTLQPHKSIDQISPVKSKEENSIGTPAEGHYVISTAVCLAELFKLMLSLFFLHLTHKFQAAKTSDEIQREVIGNPTETCKMLVPAGLYLLQNNLLFVALTNLDAATYQVTYQLRILCTAAFSWLLLGRRLSATHWLALACLMVGVALVQVDAGGSSSVDSVHSSHGQVDTIAAPLSRGDADYLSPSESPRHKLLDTLAAVTSDNVAPDDVINGHLKMESQIQPQYSSNTDTNKKQAVNTPQLLEASPNKEVAWLLGLLAVLVSCVLSAFSGVYFERIVKRSRQTSLLIRNIQLGLFSLVFGAVSVFHDRKLLWDGGFFQGYTWATWAVIALQACGGLMVSVTVKYADNILKSFAASMSIVLSTLLSTYVLGHALPSLTFATGTGIVLAASVLYGLAPSQSTLSTQFVHASTTAAVSCSPSTYTTSDTSSVAATNVCVNTDVHPPVMGCHKKTAVTMFANDTVVADKYSNIHDHHSLQSNAYLVRDESTLSEKQLLEANIRGDSMQSQQKESLQQIDYLQRCDADTSIYYLENKTDSISVIDKIGNSEGSEDKNFNPQYSQALSDDNSAGAQVAVTEFGMSDTVTSLTTCVTMPASRDSEEHLPSSASSTNHRATLVTTADVNTGRDLSPVTAGAASTCVTMPEFRAPSEGDRSVSSSPSKKVSGNESNEPIGAEETRPCAEPEEQPSQKRDQEN